MNTRCQCPSCKAVLMFDNSVDRLIRCPRCSYQGRTADFKEVPVKTVYCPNCRAEIILNLDMAGKTITCPKCKCTEVANKYMDKPPVASGTEKEETEVRTRTQTSTQMNGGKIYMPGKLELVDGGDCWNGSRSESITLKRGTNTLGRTSPNSSSSIQLPTTDPYMSKNHLIIDVVMKPDSTFEHRLSDNRSMNGTFLNDIRIEQGDVIILSPGDTLRLGHTTVKFIVD